MQKFNSQFQFKNLFAQIFLFALLLVGNQVFAQTPNAITAVNQHLRNLFTPLSRPTPSKDFLFDMAAHQAPLQFFAPLETDVLNTDVWYKVYEEMYNCAYNQAPLTPVTTVFNDANQYLGKIPFGVMNYEFYRLKSNALTTNTYFNFDPLTNTLSDKNPRPGFPYDDDKLLTACPLLTISNFANVTYRLEPQFIFFDSFSILEFQNRRQELQIDFGDGNGHHTIDPFATTDFLVVYSTAGEVVMNTRIVDLSNNSIVYSSNSRIFIASAQLSTPAMQLLVQMA